MTFGQRLKMIRNSKDLTQSQLAKMINLSDANISKYESGTLEPSLETIRMISAVLEVSIDDLIGKTDIKINLPKRKPLSPKQKKLLDEIIALPDEDIAKVIEYTQFVKSKRKP